MRIDLLILTILMAVIFAPASFFNWKKGIRRCLYFLPFAGVISLYFYPNKLPLLYKDLFFILPAYAGFLLSARRYNNPSKFLSSLLLIFSALVFLNMFNPNVSTLRVGLIGLKVWAMYIPMFFIAYNLVDSKEDLAALTNTLVVIALAPCILGILQALLIYSGHEQTAYSIYGQAAGPATQNFAKLRIGNLQLSRVPSTFTFVTQYSNFTYAMIPLAFAQLQYRKGFGFKTLLLIILAAFLSGSRSAFLFVPVLLALIYGINRGIGGVIKGLITVSVILVPFAVLFFGDFFSLFEIISQLTIHYWDEVVIGHIGTALSTTFLGMGTGMSTGPSRHAFANERFYAIENYYAKAIMELGVIGLATLLVIFGFLIYQGYKNHESLKDKYLRAYSAGLLGYILLMLGQSVKGFALDLDPSNVYFWFFSGILFKLKNLDEDERAKRGL